MSEPSIRRADVDDAGEVARLLHNFNTEFGEPTPGVADLTIRMRRLLAGGEITVILSGERPDAIALLRFRPSLWVDAPDAHLEEFYVAPERRGKGLGRAMLETAVETAREAGARRIDLGTSEDDTVARALYESAAFSNLEDGARMLFYEREL